MVVEAVKEEEEEEEKEEFGAAVLVVPVDEAEKEGGAQGKSM